MSPGAHIPYQVGQVVRSPFAVRRVFRIQIAAYTTNKRVDVTLKSVRQAAFGSMADLYAWYAVRVKQIKLSK